MNRRWVTGLAVFAVAGASGVIGFEAVRAGRLAQETFHPHPARFVAPVEIDGLEAVTLHTKDGLAIGASFLAPKNGTAIIVAHGAKANRTQLWSEVVALAKAGFGVLAFDWPGHGESAGEIRLGEPEHQAFTAAVDFLSSRPDVRHLGAYGFSNGAGLLTHLVANEPRVASLVAVAAWTDEFEQTRYQYSRWGIVRQWPAVYVARGFMGGNVRPIEDAPKLRGRPTLFVAGSVDSTVPHEMSRELAAAAGGEVRIIEGASHNDFRDFAQPPWVEQLVTFFSHAETASGATLGSQ